MTVIQDVMVGRHSAIRHPLGFVTAMFHLPSNSRKEETALARAREALDYVGLKDLEERPVAGLPFGTLKAVELARAIVSRPKLLLLDEPAGGLNHDEVEELGTLIRSIHDQLDLTLLVVEHHMNLVMGISDQVVVLDFGRKI